MPSSSTNYSYEIPTVGSDSTTYGTIINQFVESLSTKLKTVSDKINTAGVGASSTLAQVNRNIAQVNAINSRLPVGVSDLLPDPYSGATTPVSTWPYLNTELQAEGFSPPTTAQEVIDFDYSGFATYLNTRFDSLSARIVGLDAPITIADSSKLICETNAILNAIGTYKTVTRTQEVKTQTIESLGQYWVVFSGFWSDNIAWSPGTLLSQYPNSFTGLRTKLGGGNPVTITATNIRAQVAAGDAVDAGYYLNTSSVSKPVTLNFGAEGTFHQFLDGNHVIMGDLTGSSLGLTYVNNEYSGGLEFVEVVKTNTVTEVSTQEKITIDDVDLSGCS
jgi:hypothetical protein